MPDPPGVTVRRVETRAADAGRLPVGAAGGCRGVRGGGGGLARGVGVRAARSRRRPGAAPPALELVPNPDILATIAAAGPRRPRLVIGFAAETDDLMANAQAKRPRKNADWIVANDVSPATGIMGGRRTRCT